MNEGREMIAEDKRRAAALKTNVVFLNETDFVVLDTEGLDLFSNTIKVKYQGIFKRAGECYCSCPSFEHGHADGRYRDEHGGKSFMCKHLFRAEKIDDLNHLLKVYADAAAKTSKDTSAPVHQRKKKTIPTEKRKRDLDGTEGRVKVY